MTEFIRKSRLKFSMKITPLDGSTVVPAAAHLTLVYTNTSGVHKTENIDLENNAGSWECEWDTSDAGPGQVEWMAYCEGLVQAATQGAIHIKANNANLAV